MAMATPPLFTSPSSSQVLLREKPVRQGQPCGGQPHEISLRASARFDLICISLTPSSRPKPCDGGVRSNKHPQLSCDGNQCQR